MSDTDGTIENRLTEYLRVRADSVEPRFDLDGVKAGRAATAERPRPGRSVGRRIGWIAAVVSLLAFGVGGLIAATREGGDSAGTCHQAVSYDGRFYIRDTANDGVLDADDLGPVLARVEESDCGVREGTEIHSVAGENADAVVATADGGIVTLYRSTTDHLAFVGAVVEISINSETDGTTSFASLTDPQLIERLMEDLRSIDASDVSTDWTEPHYFIVFARANGIRVVVPYHIADSVLGVRATGGSRVTSDLWRTTIRDALEDAPPQPTVDGFALTGAAGTGSFHANGACRRDRPDLVVRSGETLTLNGADGRDLWWFLGEPHPGPFAEGEWEDLASQRQADLTLPAFEGTIIAELRVLDAGATPTDELCITLASG